MPCDSKREKAETQPPFWRVKSLEEMTRAEWEALCDRCAQCCVVKYEDADTGDVYYTNDICPHLDTDTRRCKVYAERAVKAPECACLTPELVREYDWLPETCAYRLIAAGRDLPDTHPLVAGKRKRRCAGIIPQEN